jgi:hypothetical protein
LFGQSLYDKLFGTAEQIKLKPALVFMFSAFFQISICLPILDKVLERINREERQRQLKIDEERII